MNHLDSRKYPDSYQNNPQPRSGNLYTGLRTQNDNVSNSPYHRGILVNGPNNNNGDNTRTPTRNRGSFPDRNGDYNKNYSSRGGSNNIQMNNIGGLVETSSSDSSDSSLTLVNSGENLRHSETHRPGYMDSVV